MTERNPSLDIYNGSVLINFHNYRNVKGSDNEWNAFDSPKFKVVNSEPAHCSMFIFMRTTIRAVRRDEISSSLVTVFASNDSLALDDNYY